MREASPARRAIRRPPPISAPSCAFPASAGGRNAAARNRARASPAMPARGSISSPISCRASAPPRRWRCSTRPRRRRTMPAPQRHWHLQRSLALLQLRRPAEARAALDAFAALGPCPPEFARAVAMAARAARARRQRRRNARRSKPGGWKRRWPSVGAQGARPSTGSWRISIWRSSGPAATTRGAPFRHWTEGHALLKPSQPFSRDDHAAFVDANIAALHHDPARNRRARQQQRSGAGFHRRHAALGHHVVRTDSRRASRRAWRAASAGALPQAFAALGGGSDSAAAGAAYRQASIPRRSTLPPRNISPSCMRSRPTRRASSTRCRATISYRRPHRR